MGQNHSTVRRAERRAEAEVRQAFEFSPEQQLDRLDARLGAGIGAAKERARIAKLIQAAA